MMLKFDVKRKISSNKTIFSSSILFAVLSFVYSSILSAEIINANISVDTEWNNTAEPYTIAAGSNVRIAPDITLTISPGVIVEFEADEKLTVLGTLYAAGTSTSPIIFRPVTGATWNGIEFSDSSKDITLDLAGNYASGSLLEYVTISGVGPTSSIGTKINGAIILTNAFPALDHLTIENNKTSAIYGNVSSSNSAPDNLTISNSSIQGNEVRDEVSSQNNSPGIHIFAGDQTTVTITSNTITNNKDSGYTNDVNTSTATAEGGGIYIQRGNRIDIASNTFTSNSVKNGGAIAIVNQTPALSPNIFIKDNVISNNNAAIDGGGIHVNSSSLEVSNNQFIANHAKRQGGGIYIANSVVDVFGNNFIKNHSVSTGGACHIDGGLAVLRFDKNVAYKNSSDEHGGVIDIHDGLSVTLNSNTFVSNSASGGGDVLNIIKGNGSFKNNSVQGVGASSVIDLGIGFEVSGNAIVSNSNIAELIIADIATGVIINNNNMFNSTGTFVFNNQPNSTLNAMFNWWGQTTLIAEQLTDGLDATALVDVSNNLSSINNNAPMSRPVGLFADNVPAGIGMTWTNNAETDVAGYRVFWSTTPISDSNDLRYDQSADVGNVTNYTIPASELSNGSDYFIAVSAYDNNRVASIDVDTTIVNDNMVLGNESWYSEEFSLTWIAPAAAPDDGGGSTSFWWLFLLALVVSHRLILYKEAKYPA